MAERIEGLSIGLDLDSMGLERSLGEIQRSFKSLGSSIKVDMNNLKYGEKSVANYKKTIDSLDESIVKQRKNLSDLKAKHEDAVRVQGANSKAAQKLATEYNKQADNLNVLERQLENASTELKEFQEEQRIANSNWTKFGDQAEKAGNKISGIGDGLKGFGSRFSMAVTTPILGGFAAITKGTEEIRWTMGRLETNAEEAGVGVDVVSKAMERLAGVSDETDSNVEAISNLLATDLSEGGMLEAMDALSGAAIKFSDTLKIEGLADGLQETLATGAAIGPFAEMLERSGVNLDTFNDGLAASIKNGTEEKFVLQQLADLGLAKVNDKYRENNKELVESREASMRFQQSMADLGTLLTPIATKITNGITGIVERFNSLSDGAKKSALVFAGIAAAIGPVLTFVGMFIGALGNIVKALGPVSRAIAQAGGLFKWLRLGLVAISGPVGITIGVITALAAGFILLYKKSDTFRGMIGTLIEKLKELGGNILDSLKKAVSTVVDFFKGQLKVLQDFWKQNSDMIMTALGNIGKFVSSVFNGIVAVIQFVMPFVLSIIKSVWGNIKGVISGALKIIMGLVQTFAGLFSGDFSKMWEGIKKIFSGALQFIWNYVQLMMWGKMLKGIVGLGKSLLSTFKSMWSGIQKTFSTVIKAIVDFVKNSFNTMRNGINSIFTGIRNFLTGIWKTIRTNIQNPIRAAVDFAKSRFTNFKDKTVEIFKSIKDRVKGYVDDMIAGVKNMPGKMKDGLVKMAGKVSDGVKAIANRMVRGLGKGVNGVIGGVNWVTGKLGIKSKISEWNVPQYAKGTQGHPGGLAVVGDGKGRNAGSELIQTPDGKTLLSPAKDTLLNLPKGTQVLSALETKNLLGNVPKYAKGVGGMIQTGVKKVKDLALNIWDYATNPGKLLNLALDTLGISRPDNSNLVGKIARGGFDLVKGKAIDFVKNMFSKAESEGGSVQAPNFGGRFRRTSGFGQRWGRLHGGVDYAAPIGTPIPSQSSGVVSFAANGWNGGFGNLVKVRQGIYEHFYAHMSRIMTRAGQRVSKGSILGLVGSTGDSTGPHVHYELRKNGMRLNPGNVGFATGGFVGNPGMYNLTEEGYGEWIIPTHPKRRTDAMKLLALAGKDIQGNKRPNQLPNPSGGSNQSEEIYYLKQNVELLMQVVMSLKNIEKKPVISEGDIGRANERHDARETIKNNIFNGRGAWA